MIKRALVIGYGSIGARHVRVLRELGLEVAVVSRHCDAQERNVFRSLTVAFAEFAPDYVVVANETAGHANVINLLATLGFSGWTLVEKPLAVNPEDMTGAVAGGRIRVAYNLRFHPAMRKLKALLLEDQVIGVQAYVGQYLPNWRLGIDYRDSYSASKVAGGGVLRDLSHELDYLRWLFGPWLRLAALGGRKSDLAIDSDDVWCVLMEQSSGALLTLQMNYLDRAARRELTIIGNRHTYRLDLIAGSLSADGVNERFEVDRDKTYRDQHLSILSGREAETASFEDGMAALHTINAIERAAVERRWVESQ
jgi:predicted dehydrogenase